MDINEKFEAYFNQQFPETVRHLVSAIKKDGMKDIFTAAYQLGAKEGECDNTKSSDAILFAQYILELGYSDMGDGTLSDGYSLHTVLELYQCAGYQIFKKKHQPLPATSTIIQQKKP